MRINYNVSAMTANNNLKRSDSALAKSLERLSSGIKINRAKDNAAGLAIAKRMHAQLEGLSVAGDNANDGVAVVEIILPSVSISQNNVITETRCIALDISGPL